MLFSNIAIVVFWVCCWAMGREGISCANDIEFYIIASGFILSYICGFFDGDHRSAKSEELPRPCCGECEYLDYNSDGSAECKLEYEHKCRPSTMVNFSKKID